MIILFFILNILSANAWETDQYTNRNQPIKDSLNVMNQYINEVLLSISDEWDKNWGQNEDYFRKQVYRKLANGTFNGYYDDWLNKSDQVDRITLDSDNIYTGAPVFGARGNIFFGVVATIQVAGFRMGTDKPAHFLSEGYFYYNKAFKDPLDLQSGILNAINSGISSERNFYGWTVSGVYSNADLVSNYEGLLFYRSLFEENIIQGKDALFVWKDDLPVKKRTFDWADHVSEYWDESLLPSNLVSSLNDHVRKKLLTMCGERKKNIKLYDIEVERDHKLSERYNSIGIIDTHENRLSELCEK